MELKQLRFLVEVADAGSINRAAERVGVAQSALSRHIARLEADLGAEVLRRTPAGVTLTPVGEQVVATAHVVLREVEDLRRLVAGAAGGLLRVRIGMPPTVTGMFRPLFEGPLRRNAARIQPSVVEASSYWLAERLATGNLDCAILTQAIATGEGQLEPLRMEPLWREPLWMEPLWVESLCLVGPAHSPFAGQESCTVAEISDLPLTLTPLPDNSRQVIEHVFREQGFVPRVVQEHEALNLLKEQTRFGAYSILPRIQARELPRAEYASVPVRDLSIRRGFAARRRALPAPVVAMLLDAVREHARAALRDDPWFRMGWN